MGEKIAGAAAATAAALASVTLAAVRFVANVVYSPTVKGKVAQGATEIANTLNTGHAYSPYTADNAAHRATVPEPRRQPRHGALTRIRHRKNR